MRKRFFLFVAVVAAFVMAAAAPKAKYVFFFIGDGMGVNQVNGTETYLGALKGRIGIEPLCFPSFPNSAFVNTQSATNGVTRASPRRRATRDMPSAFRPRYPWTTPRPAHSMPMSRTATCTTR